jgi:hypothetical protein
MTPCPDRDRIAVLRVRSGLAHPSWDPDADEPVRAFLATPSAIYVGGTFTRVGGEVRSGLAALTVPLLVDGFE